MASENSNSKKLNVAFVCLGNICRSPMAEAVFKHTVLQSKKSNHFNKIESFGTASYHIGETPDSRSVSTLKQHKVPVSHHAQQIKASHFNEYDYILAMDENNLKNLNKIKPANSKAKVCLFGDWNSDTQEFRTIVDDPYYGGIDGFEYNYNQVVHFSKNFLARELK